MNLILFLSGDNEGWVLLAVILEFQIIGSFHDKIKIHQICKEWRTHWSDDQRKYFNKKNKNSRRQRQETKVVKIEWNAIGNVVIVDIKEFYLEARNKIPDVESEVDACLDSSWSTSCLPLGKGRDIEYYQLSEKPKITDLKFKEKHYKLAGFKEVKQTCLAETKI